MTISFTMLATTVYFEIRVPFQWELENCNTIIMTDKSWDPTTISLAAASTSKWTREKQERRNISLIQVKPGEPTHDGQLASILEVFDDKCFIQRLVASVNVVMRVCIEEPLEINNCKILFIGAKNRDTHALMYRQRKLQRN
jgi:hypothetical protein